MFFWGDPSLFSCVLCTPTCAIVDTFPLSLSSLFCSPPASLFSAAAARASALQGPIIHSNLCEVCIKLAVLFLL